MDTHRAKKQVVDRVVVVGASFGGIQAVCSLLTGLPKNFQLPVFVVVHISPTHSVLPEILARCGSLMAIHPEAGELIRPGRVYVAPPNRHMLIENGRVQLSQGPRENLFRPAINPLFRSAARAYRAGVIGIILSGQLDDGAAGLFAIKARGGIAIVQDPKEAVAASMPRSALAGVDVDYRLPVIEMAKILVKLSEDKRMAKPAKSRRSTQSTIVKTAPTARATNGKPVPVSCPECDGPLFEVKNGKVSQIHCLVGHAYSPMSLSAAHSDALERAIWVAIRHLKERLWNQGLLASELAADPRHIRRNQTLAEEATAIQRDIALLEEIHERI